MNRIIAVCFFLLLMFLSTNQHVFAQTPSPVTVDQNEIINQLNQQTNCGKIGMNCCTDINIPTMQIGKPNIAPGLDQIIGYIVDFINGALGKLDSVYKFVLTNFVPSIKDILCSEGLPSDRKDLANCQCLPKETFDIAKLCTPIKSGSEKSECITCSQHGIWTAIGCVDFKLNNFIKDTVFSWGIGLAGIVALLCIIYSAFQLQVSQGNPEKIKKAQELLTSCIMGLMLIIFSVFILRLIGVDILKIPGFGR